MRWLHDLTLIYADVLINGNSTSTVERILAAGSRRLHRRVLRTAAALAERIA